MMMMIALSNTYQWSTALIIEGLEMIINIDQSNYLKDAGDTAGIRMVVHNGTRIPFPEDEGITVSPGHSTSVGIHKVIGHSFWLYF